MLAFEDDHDAVESLRLLMETEGHDFRAQGSGKYGLTRVREYRPDVVLIDIGLPDVNGFDVARILRGVLGADCPVLIAVTAHTTDDHRRVAAIAGFDHFVAKPYDPQRLLALLASAAR